jgi:uncharacterized protein (DUF1501 family)
MTGGVRLTAFGNPALEPTQDILIILSLRGGCDGLSIVSPFPDPDRKYYEQARPELAIPNRGDRAALPLDDFFGLHPAAAPLYELYQSQHLAIIHAAGMPSDTRSHFAAMQYMELGTPGQKTSTTGWLTRYLHTAGEVVLTPHIVSLATTPILPASLAGSRDTMSVSTLKDFGIELNWQQDDWQRHSLRRLYSGEDWLRTVGANALDFVDVLAQKQLSAYQPHNGAVYPDDLFGRNLMTVAQVIKRQMGLRVATVDLAGWDTHGSQGDAGGGYFADRVNLLAQGLAAFYTDLSQVDGTDHTKRLTVVVMSEFGRSLHQNGSGGTDHGHGNVMFVLGGQVNGGKVFGQWPGLATDQLYDRRDVAITTDYRQVLSEILARRLGHDNLGYIFPNYANDQLLGIIRGDG